MGIIPKVVAQMWEQMERPHRLFDQRFGMAMPPQSFFGPSIFDGFHNRRSPYYRPWADEMIREMQEFEKGFSMIKDDKDKFNVALDVQQFKPEEINVKVIDNFIVVEGKHFGATILLYQVIKFFCQFIAIHFLRENFIAYIFNRSVF